MELGLEKEPKGTCVMLSGIFWEDEQHHRKKYRILSSHGDIVYYQVTDPSDNALEPKPGTLRYGATMIRGKKWTTFQRDMRIRLEKPLLISSFTAIDGRGPGVHIAGKQCNHPWPSNPPLLFPSTKLSYGSRWKDNATGSG